jgi:hypothetical protein
MRKSVALTASLSLLLLASLPLAMQGRSLLRTSQSQPVPLNVSAIDQKADYVDLSHALNRTAPIWQTSGTALPAIDPTHPLVVVDNSGKIKKGTPVMLVAIGLAKAPGASQATPRVLAVRSVDSLQTALAILQPSAAPAPKQAHLLKRSTPSLTKSTL